MKVKIISGTYGRRTVTPGTKIVRVHPVSKGEQVDVSDAEAARLVGLGIAAYADEEKPREAVVTPPPGEGDNSPGSDIPNGGGGTPGQETGGSDEPVLVIVDGHYTVESLVQLTRKKLDEMADALGVDAGAIKKCGNKGEVAALIAAVEVTEEDEKPPQPTAEIPGT